MWKKIKFYAVSMIILALSATCVYLYYFGRGEAVVHRVLDPPAVVKEIQRLSELVTVKYSIQKVVGLKEEKVPFGSEQVLLMVQADVTWLDGSVVRFVGSLRELPAFYNRVRVIISSTRFGAGVKLKTVEAVQYGVPVVCTEEAATGLDEALRAGVWVAKDAGAFADAVIALLTDQPTWERQRQLTFARHDASSIQQLGVGLWPAIIRSAC